MKARGFLVKYFLISLLITFVLVAFKLGGRSGNNTFLSLAIQIFILSGLLFNHIKENYGKITDQYMYKLTAGVCLISILFIPAFSKNISTINALGHMASTAAINAAAVFVITYFSIKIIESTPPSSGS